MKKIMLSDLMMLSVDDEGEGGGSVDSTSIQREVCPFCSHPECRYNCDGSTYEYDDEDEEKEQVESYQEHTDRLIHNSCVDTIEFMTLALCNALEQNGIKVDKNIDVHISIVEAIKTTMDTLGNVELPCPNETSDYHDVDEDGNTILVEHPPKEL